MVLVERLWRGIRPAARAFLAFSDSCIDHCAELIAKVNKGRADVLPVVSRVLEHLFGELNMIETTTSYKCSDCGMTKTIPAAQEVPSCCGKLMQETAAQEPGESKEGSCCSG